MGVSLDFERWTGSEQACAQLATNAGFADVSIDALPIADSQTAAEAESALPRMLANPLCAPLARACRADAAVFDRLRTEYARLVDGSLEADGCLRTRGECFVVVGTAHSDPSDT